MRKLLCLVLAVLLWGCAPVTQEQKVYEATFLELFDTVTAIRGRAESQEAFTQQVQVIRDRLEHYHRLFDIYNDYPGLNNLKTVNDNAGIAPVQVDPAILDLLQDCKGCVFFASDAGNKIFLKKFGERCPILSLSIVYIDRGYCKTRDFKRKEYLWKTVLLKV